MESIIFGFSARCPGVILRQPKNPCAAVILTMYIEEKLEVNHKRVDSSPALCMTHRENGEKYGAALSRHVSKRYLRFFHKLQRHKSGKAFLKATLALS